MNWTKKNYEIKLNDEKTGFISGVSNGLFGVSFGCTLTHLKSGYKIAEFRDEESAKRVADYLSDKYVAAFAALNKEYRPTMTHDEYKELPSAKDLNFKIKSDAYFQAQIAEYAVKSKDDNNDND